MNDAVKANFTRKLLWSSAALMGVTLVGSAGFMVIFGGAVSFLDALFHTMNQITTVGASTVLPVDGSNAAKIWSMVVTISGIGVFLYIATSITAFFVDGDLQTILKLNKMSKAISSMENHYVVCGCGDSGHHVAMELYRTHRKMLIIDIEPEKVESLFAAIGQEVPYLIGDATNDITLEKAKVDKAAGLVTTLPEDKDNIYVTISARQINPTIRIVAKAIDDHAQRKLKHVGANSVVSPSLIGGMRMISELVRPQVVSFLDHMMREHDPLVRIEELVIPNNSPIRDKTIADIAVQQTTGLLILAIRKAGTTRFIHKPHPETETLSPGDTLVVYGAPEGMRKLRELVAL